MNGKIRESKKIAARKGGGEAQLGLILRKKGYYQGITLSISIYPKISES